MPKKFSSHHITYLLIVGFLTSCSELKSTHSTSNTAGTPANPRFINGIEITPGMSTTLIRHIERTLKHKEKIEAGHGQASTNTEAVSALQVKYGTILDVPIESIVGDSALLQEVDDWWGTPYQMGGATKSGVDCSAFSQIVLQDIFATSIPRTAQQQYENATHTSPTEQLQKGDLVFFGSGKHHISHVGIYIANNKFVHASSSHGVMISDLNDSYWGRRYVGSGRYSLSDTISRN